MDSLFIEPSTLPGGAKWIAACAAAVVPLNATSAQHVETELLRESLRCNSSPIGGLFQVLLLLCVYGAILFFVRVCI